MRAFFLSVASLAVVVPAMGTTGLFSPQGIVEIEVVAYAPLSP